MLLQGKCAAIAEQIKSKVEQGVSSFELQLFKHDDVDVVIATLEEFKEVNIIVVHTALDNTEGALISSVCLDNLDHPFSQQLFTRACYIAQYLGERQDSKVGIVLHNTFTAQQFLSHPSVLNHVADILKIHLHRFPNIYVMFENVTPYNGKTFQLHNGCTPNEMLDIITLFKERGVELFVCLDLCHNAMSRNSFERLLSNTSAYDAWCKLDNSMNYKEWFKLLNDNIRNIHVAKAIGDGCGYGKHGAPLISTDVASITQLYEVCKLYNPQVIWTVEVFDDDHVKAQNMIATYNFCKHVMGGDCV